MDRISGFLLVSAKGKPEGSRSRGGIYFSGPLPRGPVCWPLSPTPPCLSLTLARLTQAKRHCTILLLSYFTSSFFFLM